MIRIPDSTLRTQSDASVIRVLSVDDNECVGAALQAKFQSSQRFEWLGQLTSASGLVEQVEAMKPDVVVLDVDIPGSEPFAELERMRNAGIDVPVVMLSAHVRLMLIDTAMNAGASGYLSKSEPPDVIVNAIERIARGEVVFSPLVEAIVEESL